MLIWNLTRLLSKGGIYGYTLQAEIIGGWAVSILVFVSGYIIHFIARKMKKVNPTEEPTWDTVE